MSKRPADKESVNDEEGTDKSQPMAKTKKRRLQSFREDYLQKFPTLSVGRKTSTAAYCRVCDCEFSVAHGGFDDCRRHCESKKHKDNEKKDVETKKCAKISGYFVSSASASQTTKDNDGASLIYAEVMLIDLVTELNLPISSLDTFNKAFPRMFSDSNIAKNMHCGRSKGTAILKEISAKTTNDIADRLRTQPFTVSTDGSNDNGSNKLFPIVVRTYDPDDLTVRSELISIPKCEGSATGQKICDLITTEFAVHNMPASNCIALGADNAPVMSGKINGCFGNLLKAHPKAYFSGCVCHLIHIAAQKGAACLPLDAGQMLVDVYYYLDKSSKRQSSFKQEQVLCDLKEKKIIKHVSTRWLSIQNCLPRVIESWQALYHFFKEEEINAKGPAEKEKTGRLRKLFQSPTNKAYCMFLVDALAPFDAINTKLQCEEPLVYCLKNLLEKFLRQLLVRFVKPSALLYKAVMDVSLDQSCNIKDSKDLTLGHVSEVFNELREEKKKEFLDAAKEFYLSSCKYLQSKLPLKDEVLQHAVVADPSKQLESKFSSLRYFLTRYPCIVPKDFSVEDVANEFADYQSKDIRQCIDDRVDKTWGKISKMMEDGERCFKVLPKVMAAILTIPHSSAHCERVFSQVRKNSTEFRSSMGHETLQALMVNKGRPGSFLDRSYTPQDYSDFKSAYYKSLKG